MTRKVTARTNGIVMATTMPGRTSKRQGFVWAQTDKAHSQHHHHGLDQDFDEFPTEDDTALG